MLPRNIPQNGNNDRMRNNAKLRRRRQNYQIFHSFNSNYEFWNAVQIYKINQILNFCTLYLIYESFEQKVRQTNAFRK